MKADYLVNSYNAADAMLKLKNVAYEFRKFVIAFKKYLHERAEEVLDGLDAWNETNKEIALKYAKRDENGKVIYKDLGDGKKGFEMPLFGENEEYDEEEKEHREKKKSLLSEKIELEEAFDKRIDKKYIPTKNEEFDGAMQVFIQDYIDG